jgi:hypothetical protein
MDAARRLILVGALLLGAAAPAQAGWFYDTVAATLTAKGKLVVTTPFGPPAPVRFGTSFSGQVFDADQGVGFDVSVDVDGYEIVVRFAGTHGGRLVDPDGLLDITLSGLSPVPYILVTTFPCETPWGFCQWPDGAPEATLTDNMPDSLVLGFAALEDGINYVYAIPIPNEVPAPGAWPLMLTGLLGLGVASRLRGAARQASRQN